MEVVQLHCKQCNQRLMDYMVAGDKNTVVMQGIVIKCVRCKRVLIMKKYTEGMLLQYAQNGKIRI
jgi:uncharacterized CHY-type Zn-finger protein